MTMRKKIEPKDYSVVTTFPLIFWQECMICDNEYVREPMWKISTEIIYRQRMATEYKYVCKHCLTNIKYAVDFTKKYKGLTCRIFKGPHGSQAMAEREELIESYRLN